MKKTKINDGDQSIDFKRLFIAIISATSLILSALSILFKAGMLENLSSLEAGIFSIIIYITLFFWLYGNDNQGFVIQFMKFILALFLQVVGVIALIPALLVWAVIFSFFKPGDSYFVGTYALIFGGITMFSILQRKRFLK